MTDEQLTQALKQEMKKDETNVVPMLPGGRYKVMAKEVVRRKRVRQMQETALFYGIALFLLGLEHALLNTSGMSFVLLQGAMIGLGIILFVVLSCRKTEAKRHG